MEKIDEKGTVEFVALYAFSVDTFRSRRSGVVSPPKLVGIGTVG